MAPKPADLAQKVRRGRPPNSNAEDTRERLLLAAAEHFGSAEFSDVKMEQIAAHAGVSGAAIYNHFASKDDLFASTARRHMESGLEVVEEEFSRDGSWRSRLKGLLDRMAREDSVWFQFPLLTRVIQLRMARDPGQYPAVRTLRAAYLEQFADLAARAIEEGDFPPSLNPAMVGELMMYYAFNVFGAIRSHHGSAEFAALATAAAEMLGGHSEGFTADGG